MFYSRISTFVLFQVRGLPEATGCHPPHQIEPGSQMQGSKHGPNRGPHHEHRNLRCAMLCALHHCTKAKAERQRQMATFNEMQMAMATKSESTDFAIPMEFFSL